MEFILERKRVKEIELGVMFGFYALTVVLGCIPILEHAGSFVLPLIMVAYCCGYKYVFMYYVGLITSCLFVSGNETIVVMAISIGVFFQLANLLRITNMFYMPVLIVAVTVFYLSVYQFHYKVVVMSMIVSIIHCYLYKELIPIVIHQTMDQFIEKKWIVVCILSYLMTTIFYEVNPIFMIVLIRYFFIMSIYYLNMQVAIPSVFYIAILLLLQSQGLQTDILAILLPSFIYFIYKPKNKIQCISIYLLSHIFLPFFIDYDYFYQAFVIVMSSLLFIVTPKLSYHYPQAMDQFIHTNKQKLQQKTDSFRELFQQLIDVFQNTNSLIPVQQYVDYAIDDICTNCSSKEHCFRSSYGTTRLVKLMLKGVKEDMNEEDKQYIKEYCINAPDYFQHIQKHRQNYVRLKQTSKENQHLKEDLLEEFSVFSNVFENFHDSVRQVQLNEQHLLEHLKGYHFDIQYLKKIKISKESYYLDLGIMQISRKIIETELLPIIESFYQQNFSIYALQESVPHYGYMSLRLKYDTKYRIEHGFQQIAYDKQVCGDNYTVFKKENVQYFALSDGMGQGLEASKESKLTLDILSKLVMNGISLKDTIDSINALLRVKNRSDMYTTLDLCAMDCSSGEASFVKYGANTTYYVHHQKVVKLENHSLPVGVVKDLKMTSYQRMMEQGDMIILTSDGVGDRFEYIIQAKLMMFENQHAQTIAGMLMKEVQIGQEQDDTSILVLKITD